MDKLKNLLKSDTPTDEQTESSGVTGKITGQGSHFPAGQDSTTTAPTTVTGTDPSTQGPADVSAVKADPIQASSTAGPEQDGTGHVNTVSAESVSKTQTTSGGSQEAQSYNVTNADFPKTTSAADGSGTAAIGTTTTYKSSSLSQGDPTSSVIDKDSSDPVTYQKPESGAGSTGVGAGAAATAASVAFTSSQDRGPGHENPYRSTAIDPRVDGGSKASEPVNTTSGSATGTVQAPSSLTSTKDPIERSTVYDQVTSTQGLDKAEPTSTSTSEPVKTSEDKSGVLGKVLGAVGLGGVAGTAAAKLSSDNKEAVPEDATQPTTTTGVSSYVSPEHQGPGHHRKESIPTTAYPAGVDSPGAINAPVGGTRSESASQANISTTTQASGISSGQTATTTDQSKKEDDHTARNVGLGAGAGAAVAGAGAIGAHEYSKKEAEKAEAEAARQHEAQQKEIHEQQKAAEKQAEKEQKEIEKEAKKEQKAAEKEEKAHQKSLEKAEKKEQKELKIIEKKHDKMIEKEEKRHEKEEKEHQKQLEAQERERQERLQEEEDRRKAAAAAVAGVGAGAGTAAVAEHEKEKHADTAESEKKPSILKRIFKKRKNSKTGEEEEYESDDDNKGSAIAGGTAVAGGTTGAAVLASREHNENPNTTATSGQQPLQADPLAATPSPAQTGAAGFVSTQADGKSQYTVIPQPATESTTTTTTTTTSDTRPTEPITGLAYDPSKDPKTAANLHSHEHGEGMGAGAPGTTPGTTTATTTTGEHGRTSLEERIEAMTHDNFGVIEDHRR